MSPIAHESAAELALLEVTCMDLSTPAGRPLLRGLNLSLGRDQVALIGRNGVGKSSLLEVLSGHATPSRGGVVLRTQPLLVPQAIAAASVQPLDLLLHAAAGVGVTGELLAVAIRQAGLPALSQLRQRRGLSLGEQRKLHLLAAQLAHPELLILDEPTEDLDADGNAWLRGWLHDWDRGLLVVSHDRALLRLFRNFFVVAESGCRYFAGTLSELEAMLETEQALNQRKFVRRLNVLAHEEQHSERLRNRRERKKNVGRVRELGRGTPRCQLNQKRSAAQHEQGRSAKIRENRISAVRGWAKAARRALSVSLPLEMVMPPLPESCSDDLVVLDRVTVEVAQRTLFCGVSLRLGHDRLAVVGPNGAGKTTLLRLMLGEVTPAHGTARRQRSRIGAIAQGGTDWMLEESVLEQLLRLSEASSPEEVAQVLVAHRFPFALAERPLASLSPGERVRAALICLLQRRPAPELLILDEPTHALDFVGAAALRAVLEAWPGGLVVVSHDLDFLDSIRLGASVVLDGHGGYEVVARDPHRGLSTLQPGEQNASD